MSASPAEDYIKATKLIETFSSFFDKVNATSNNQDLNSKKLSQLKKALYQNIHSSDKILTASEDLCTKIPEPPKQLLRTNSRTSTSSDDFNSQRGELHSSALSQSNAKARSFAPSPTQSGVIKNETKQTVNQDGFVDSLFDKPQLSTEYLPSTSFLALIKAASHSDMSKLFSLTSSYSNIRAFNGKHQSIFTALCFSYLEKLVKEKSKELNAANQNKDMDVLEAKENEFLTACKNLTQGNNETDILKKFYENVSTNARLYHQAISIFKSHIERILADKNINVHTKTESFEWMNDVDSNADSAFFQGLAQELKWGLKFLILTSDKLTEKIFSADKTDTSSKKELTIFYDKASRSAFLLYPTRKPIEDEMESSLYHKTKLKMISGHHHKPPLNSDSLKSLKTLGADYGGSLTTLDTVSGSVTSLNDLVENKEREKPVQPRILTLSKPSQLRKANTLNVFTNSLNECSSSFTYPESAVVRPSTEKIVPPSPHSASKDLGYYRSRTYDEEDSLTPKGKEPAPTRPSNFNTLRENSIVDERISDIPAQNLAQKLSKEVLSNRNFFLDRSSTQEYKRPYMSDSKPKGDLLGKTYSMDFSVGEFTLRRGSEKPSVVRPTIVPIAVKSRLDRFNQTINKHDQEVIRLTSKYLKKENNTEKGTGLTNIMNSYQAIMNQTKNNNGFRPTIGAALKMDD